MWTSKRLKMAREVYEKKVGGIHRTWFQGFTVNAIGRHQDIMLGKDRENSKDDREIRDNQDYQAYFLNRIIEVKIQLKFRTQWIGWIRIS